ncbi:DUF3953 domain-containing protein [Fictibacillus sp. FJAT-27399]|uniref:DUF3953 domain-containing protein n=1 Tax=Fictibacillus sp. FJAT-27399 TaxID=1729689 RepID=UPI0007853790|nr:DUF3953 domain-containing protein [Fictibacillus sp. FJAT-27399]
MLKILRRLLSIITLIFATYGLIAGNFKYNPIMIFLLGLVMLIMGVEEFQRKQRAKGWLLIAVFLLSTYVSIEGFLLS